MAAHVGPRSASAEASPAGAARVLAALRHLAEHPAGSRLADVANGLGAPKSSAHRALGSLIRAGFARQDRDGSYHVGFELLRLVFSYHEARVPSLLVGPLLQRLADETGETTHYGVLVGSEIVYQAKVSGTRNGLQMSSVIGGSNPAYRTGIGKALLMFELPDLDSVRSYVARTGPLKARTANTIRTAEALHAALHDGRRRGYTLDQQENDLGIVCIAFPVFLDSPTRPTGAISVSAVANRTGIDELIAHFPRIREIVAEELGAEVLMSPTEPPNGADRE
jgi:DNA-binding IclR family transcriptional regulator